MKKLGIIGGGYMACIFAQNAREMEIETHCFSLKKGVVDAAAFDFVYDVDILDMEKVLDLCKACKIDGVVATTELTIAVAAFVAEKMGLTGIPLEVAQVVTDKYRNRMVTEKIESLHHPRFAKVNRVEDVYGLDFNYPIILKPTGKGGKRGVVVIKDIHQLESAFSYAIKDAGGECSFIVEEYIDGEMECSIESLSFGGCHYIIQITEKVSSGAPHCVELAHHQPANLSSQLRQKIEKVIRYGLSAIGITNGPCHAEIKIKDGNIYIIEFNARPGGDHIAHPLTMLSTGYEYIKGAIEIALGEFSGIDKIRFVNKCAGVIFVTEQTKEFKQIFENCEHYPWFYKKNHVSDKLKSIVHNDGFNTNYFIYVSDERPNFDVKEN